MKIDNFRCLWHTLYDVSVCSLKEPVAVVNTQAGHEILTTYGLKSHYVNRDRLSDGPRGLHFRSKPHNA